MNPDLTHCRTCGKNHPEVVEVCTCDLEKDLKQAIKNRAEAIEKQEHLSERIAGLEATITAHEAVWAKCKDALDTYKAQITELEARVTEYKALQNFHDTEMEMQCEITAKNQKKQTEEACVNAILNGSQFFLAGIEPEMREAVVRRALNLTK